MDLKREQIAISTQLQEMQMGGGMSIWPKPILHPSRPPCDVANMITIKACGLCQWWYHCYDIAVTSCLHTYHLTCLGEHLKTNNNCKVCNQQLHPNWWTSWGFRALDKDLIFAAEEMGLEQKQVQMLNEIKDIAKLMSILY
jgi:hypothetical protein